MEEENILKCEITEIDALQRAYMPFVDRGGIFVNTDKEYTLGEKLQILLTLPDEKETITFNGTVVWTTPNTGKVVWIAPGNTSDENCNSGVGVQFSDPDAKALRKKIEKLLVDHTPSEQSTDTI